MHTLKLFYDLTLATAAGVGDWWTGVKMRKKMRGLLGRRVNDLELVSIRAWMDAEAKSSEQPSPGTRRSTGEL
jgi:hypothetical protein